MLFAKHKLWQRIVTHIEDVGRAVPTNATEVIRVSGHVLEETISHLLLRVEPAEGQMRVIGRCNGS